MTKPQWEIELREKWMNYFYDESRNCKQKPTHITPDTHGIIIDFIRSQIEKSYQQGVEDMRRKCVENVGMLRQWLNEDRITDTKKLVTNEEIEHWLNYKSN